MGAGGEPASEVGLLAGTWLLGRCPGGRRVGHQEGDEAGTRPFGAPGSAGQQVHVSGGGGAGPSGKPCRVAAP